MTLYELSDYFNAILHNETFSQDISLNGIQIENSAPKTKQILKIAFAVDACTETIKRTIEEKADLLFVHHGLFWGTCETVTGIHYTRISKFISHDIALYASHIPLDANKEIGNNYGLAKRLGLLKLEEFGIWRNMSLGVKGYFDTPITVNELIGKLFPDGKKPLHVLPFGPNTISSVAIISGGAGEDVEQAITAGADAYITGEIAHEQYHLSQESGITVIAGGHYQTETVGINLMRERLEKETGVETVFIDVPTGL